ncbi:hypothetical protein NE236_41920 [Actinoallomurus purpureus]|uniref:deazapurine DNA modification protein DpdA family protein n=1 Tax=Actinoallomurus purpureus TaxID=478114 RepID=UPI0020924EDD|nr:hypothetical protein [Actinoallomurus purpureus]MCO6011529.1 hypothetical protein [Actinoallomurus purpureus]
MTALMTLPAAGEQPPLRGVTTLPPALSREPAADRPARSPLTFYLGISEPSWVGEDSPLPDHIPVCLSCYRIRDRKSLPRATRPVLLDSGGFSVLSKKRADGSPARWDLTPQQFVKRVRWIIRQLGRMPDAIAIMDWMCEQFMLARTGLTVEEHRRRTVISALELMWIAPDLPWMFVLQGNAEDGPDDHLRCADMYEQAGIDLAKAPMVGVGSVCRLQATDQIITLFAALDERFAGQDVRLHGLGMKKLAYVVAPAAHSWDSQGWSLRGRNAGPCQHGLGHVHEGNCPYFAVEWYDQVLTAAARVTPEQWRRTVRARTVRRNQQTLFAPPAPHMPTLGQSLARAARVFLPDNGDPEQTELAAALDAFRAQVTAPQPSSASQLHRPEGNPHE